MLLCHELLRHRRLITCTSSELEIISIFFRYSFNLVLDRILIIFFFFKGGGGVLPLQKGGRNEHIRQQKRAKMVPVEYSDSTIHKQSSLTSKALG